MGNINLSRLGSDAEKPKIIEEIHRTIKDVNDLPTLPNIAEEARRLVNDPNSNMFDLVKVIEEDVALTGRILRISNSAYYGIPRKVDNLRMALVILGMNEIGTLVTTISVLKMFQDQEEVEGFNLREFWRHAAVSAELTVGLYEALGLPCPSGAYISGLLHDIGKLVLNQYFKEYFIACLKLSTQQNLTHAEAEKQLLGIDHGHIGAWLTERWNLPDEITSSIAQHHYRSSSTPADSTAVFVDWADRLSYILDGHSVNEVSDILYGNPEWMNWIGSMGATTDQLVNFLQEKVKRSVHLIEQLT